MRCGLLGRTLGHSYSPQIHRLLGDYEYDLFEKEPEEVASFLKSGDFTCEKLMKQKKVQLMLLDSGVSANTREKYEAMCSAAEIDCLYIEDLGRLIGKDAHKTAAVTDRHFAGIIREAYQATEQAN